MKRSLPMLALLLALDAGAAQPLVTDDASILERGFCQLEAWHRWGDNGDHEGWGVPACGVHKYLELSIGGARYRSGGEGHGKLLVQAKTVFWRAPEERWSIGAVATAVRDTGRTNESNWFHEYAALGLVSFNHPNEVLRLHANAGVVGNRGEFNTYAWGTAVEYDFAESWTLLAEVFRNAPGRPSYQAGIRFTMVQDRVELFLTGGDRIGGQGGEWFVKFGARLQSWKWF
jgi:hypothetical protein